MIVNWVNRFCAAGPDALKARRKEGRKKTLMFQIDKVKFESSSGKNS